MARPERNNRYKASAITPANSGTSQTLTQELAMNTTSVCESIFSRCWMLTNPPMMPVPKQNHEIQNRPFHTAVMANAADTRKHTSDSGEQRPIAVIQPWRLRCTLQHGELMTQHDDLEVLRASRTDGQHNKSDEQTVEETAHPADSGAKNPQVNGPPPGK